MGAPQGDETNLRMEANFHPLATQVDVMEAQFLAKVIQCLLGSLLRRKALRHLRIEDYKLYFVSYTRPGC